MLVLLLSHKAQALGYIFEIILACGRLNDIIDEHMVNQ